jgi:hypothetical protein
VPDTANLPPIARQTRDNRRPPVTSKGTRPLGEPRSRNPDPFPGPEGEGAELPATYTISEISGSVLLITDPGHHARCSLCGASGTIPRQPAPPPARPTEAWINPPKTLVPAQQSLNTESFPLAFESPLA